MIIGITGKSGSGKSYLSKMIAENINALHIDVDEISHQVLSFSETQKFLKREFGSDVFDDGILNRKKLGRIVFCNHDKLHLLNKFCKLQIEKSIDNIIENETRPIILDYLLLPWLKQFKNCDIKILLKTDFETRFNRVKTRENITREYFLARDKSMHNYNEHQFDIIFDKQTNETIGTLLETIKSKIIKE